MSDLISNELLLINDKEEKKQNHLFKMIVILQIIMTNISKFVQLLVK